MKKKRGLSLLLVCCILMMSSLNGVMAASNDVVSGIYMKNNMILTYYGKTGISGMKGYGNEETLINSKLPENVENVKAVSDNGKVLTVVKIRHERQTSLVHLDVKVRKAGTAKVRLTGTVNGKKVTNTTTVKVVKYKNPIVSFKLNTKDYASKFKATAGVYTTKKSPGKYKISCKAATGWKIKKIIGIRIKSEDDTDIGEYKNVKNNSIVNIKKGQAFDICVELYNKKLKMTENISIVIRS